MGATGVPFQEQTITFPFSLLFDSDCDSDDDCEGTLRCYHRNSDDTEPIPGCLGVPSGGTDYCYDGPPVLRSLPDTQKPFEECVG